VRSKRRIVGRRLYWTERFIAERSNNRRAAQDAAEIRRILVTVWGEKPVGKITTGDVKDLINRIKVKAPYSARTTWTHLIGIFKMAVHEEMLEASPMASLDRRLLFKNCKIGPRQRTLNDSEVAAYWSASKKMPYPFGPFYQLLLLTGVRVSELTGAQWSEINPEVRRWMREAKASGKSVDWSAVDNNIKTWTVPRERFKSDAEHIVPLSNAALSIIETIPPVRRLRLSV
jgi:integrase